MKNLLLIGFFLVTWNEFQLKTDSECSKVKWTKECAQQSIYDIVIATNSIRLSARPDMKKFTKLIAPGSFNVKVEEVRP